MFLWRFVVRVRSQNFCAKQTAMLSFYFFLVGKKRIKIRGAKIYSRQGAWSQDTWKVHFRTLVSSSSPPRSCSGCIYIFRPRAFKVPFLLKSSITSKPFKLWPPKPSGNILKSPWRVRRYIQQHNVIRTSNHLLVSIIANHVTPSTLFCAILVAVSWAAFKLWRNTSETPSPLWQKVKRNGLNSVKYGVFGSTGKDANNKLEQFKLAI